MGIKGETEAIAKTPPTASGGTDIGAGQSLTLAAITTSAVTPVVAPAISAANGTPFDTGGGAWFTFICTADASARFFGNAADKVTPADPGAAVAADYLCFPANQEREYWIDASAQNFRAFSTPGGTLKWHRSSR